MPSMCSSWDGMNLFIIISMIFLSHWFIVSSQCFIDQPDHQHFSCQSKVKYNLDGDPKHGFPQWVQRSALRTGLKSLADWLGVGKAEKSEDLKATGRDGYDLTLSFETKVPKCSKVGAARATQCHENCHRPRFVLMRNIEILATAGDSEMSSSVGACCPSRRVTFDDRQCGDQSINMSEPYVQTMIQDAVRKSHPQVA